ncbi:hypothetical protein Tco_0314748, partial [Tanacetum coccineum]
WVMVEFDSSKSKDSFRDNVGVNSWFSEIKQAYVEFTPNGRIVWVEIEGIPGKAFWVRAKEVPGWVPDLLDVSDDEDDADDGYMGGDNCNNLYF